MFRTSMLDDPSVLDEYSTVNNIIEKMTIIWNSYHDTFSKIGSELESGVPHIDPWQRSFEERWDMISKTSFGIIVLRQVIWQKILNPWAGCAFNNVCVYK